MGRGFRVPAALAEELKIIIKKNKTTKNQKTHLLKIMNDQGKNAKPQRSPWTLRINFNFPLIRTKIAPLLLEGSAQPRGPEQL